MTLKDYLIRYLVRVGTVLSIAFNVIVLFGPSNQTTSARNWQWKREGKFNLVRLIDRVLGKEHCLESWVYWVTYLARMKEYWDESSNK